VSNEELRSERAEGSTWVRTYLLPLAALVVVVAIVSVLVLTGVVESDQPRVGPGEAPTTLPTVEVVP
jgi:hypothetical protein